MYLFVLFGIHRKLRTSAGKKSSARRYTTSLIAFAVISVRAPCDQKTSFFATKIHIHTHVFYCYLYSNGWNAMSKLKLCHQLNVLAKGKKEFSTPKSKSWPSPKSSDLIPDSAGVIILIEFSFFQLFALPEVVTQSWAPSFVPSLRRHDRLRSLISVTFSSWSTIWTTLTKALAALNTPEAFAGSRNLFHFILVLHITSPG